jgi:hypothetical protein
MEPWRIGRDCIEPRGYLAQDVDVVGIGDSLPNQFRVTILNPGYRIKYQGATLLTYGSIDLCRIVLRQQRCTVKKQDHGEVEGTDEAGPTDHKVQTSMFCICINRIARRLREREERGDPFQE